MKVKYLKISYAYNKLTNMAENLNTIHEININVDSEYELEELREKMKYISNQIALEFRKLKKQSINVTEILEKNYNNEFMNENFDEQELVEEHIDNLLYQYEKVKKYLKYGRDVRFYKEKKEKEKSNEIRYAKNLLAHFGIKSIT